MRKTAIGLLMVALLITLAVCAQAAVEIYEAKASALVPAFIDYKLNCAADVTISILPSTSGGVPTGPAIRTVTFTGQTRGFHRYIWLADKDDTSTAPEGYYVATIAASATQASWGPITGIYTKGDWTHEYPPDPVPPFGGDTEGFYDIAINSNPSSAYYGRVYVTHKVQKHVFMYGPDGAYLDKFDDSAVGVWGTSAPWNVAVADDDYVYVTDRSNAVIHCFTPDGQTLVSTGGGTYFRGFFARTTEDGVTHLFMTGSAAGTHKVTVSADHLTYSGMQLCYNTGGTDGWDAYGLWVSPSLQVIYAACLPGTTASPNLGLTKWVDDEGDGTYAKDNFFNKDLVGECTDVSLVGGASPFLWVTKMVAFGNDDTATTQNEYARAVVKADPLNGSIIAQDPYNLVTYGHMSTVDSVGNLGVTYGKSTASWGQRYWGLFAEAGVTTATKTTGAFELTATPAPVVVPDSAVWTPDNTIAADNSDSGSVTFKVMDVNGWADVSTVTLDLQPIGYGSAVSCALARDLTDPLNKTVNATLTGIKAKVGARCTTSNGQPVHYLVATCTDTTAGSNTDDTEIELQVTGDEGFNAYVWHTVAASWKIDGANIVAVGGGIPGATDPRAAGPFTYTSIATVGGYASLEMSAGSFELTAQKTGFGSQAPLNITVPYTSGTEILYLRPLTIAECRATGNATFVNVEGVCYAQPVGYVRDEEGTPSTISAYGLASRTDTKIQRNQWYVCDANKPEEGMLFLITEPSTAFILQWDNPDGLAPPFYMDSTYIGKRPAVGETIMITGLLDIPGGHERRVLIQSGDLELAMAAMKQNRIYLNRGDLGGLPGTPASKTISEIYHPLTTGSKTEWGQYVQITDATVVAVHADGLPNPNPQDLEYTYPPYFTVANMAGDTCEVVLETPTSLAMTTWTSTVTVGKTFTIKGAGGRRTRYANGCIRVRGDADLTQTGDAPAAPGGLDVARTGNDSDPVNVHGIVTLKSGSSLWIEAADRSIGIRVKLNPAYIAVGNDVQVVGTLGTESGERVITPTSPLLPISTGNTIGELDMRSREIGGVGSGTTPGVDTGRGALNVGLKIHFLGMVTGIDAGNAYYYLWDGANRSDLPTSDGNAYGFLGVKVEAAPPAGCAAWTNWVEVVGVVSTNDVSGSIIPTIKPISATKVTAFDTITAPVGTALQDQWNLMSVIAAPAADSDGDEWSSKAWEPYIALGPTQDPFDVDGRMYRWENCSGGLYIWDLWSEVGSHGPFGGLMLGDGYWLQLDIDWPVSYSGKNSTRDQWIGVCNSGWMIIGQPKDHSTYLVDVQVHDGGKVWSMYEAVIDNYWIDCVGYWWDNQNQGLVDVGIPDCWASTDTLVPWRGYWIQAYQGDLALIVPEAPEAP